MSARADSVGAVPERRGRHAGQRHADRGRIVRQADQRLRITAVDTLPNRRVCGPTSRATASGSTPRARCGAASDLMRKVSVGDHGSRWRCAHPGSARFCTRSWWAIRDTERTPLLRVQRGSQLSLTRGPTAVKTRCPSTAGRIVRTDGQGVHASIDVSQGDCSSPPALSPAPSPSEFTPGCRRRPAGAGGMRVAPREQASGCTPAPGSLRRAWDDPLDVPTSGTEHTFYRAARRGTPSLRCERNAGTGIG